ncbi:MAG: 50S ribosomal protein L10 [Candidatus Marinimicrobia bacterium]|nr:50S ribosomal protein L10 [Candidatus Neomarinimicrobiota bacterium]MCF7851587.1 50S ribosomal protein L10 [Candidatus Neomarinimicrobiota bacterium]MCF7905000.1 50S ribosomal protein L10 [Candidatus Neomarinimicrobiota bacterium]
MPNQQNINSLDSIREKISNASAIYFTDYVGLTVEETNALRSQFHEASVEYRVLKNTLVNIAVKEQGFEGLEEVLKGPTALAFGAEDPTAPARVIKEFLKKEGKAKEKPAVKGLVFEGKVLDASFYEKLANLPSKEELLAKLLGDLMSPMQNTLSVLQAPMRNLVGVLTSLKETKN